MSAATRRRAGRVARRCGLAAALVLALCGGAALAQADERAQVQRLIQEGQHARALDAAEARLAARPGDREMRFLKAVALSNLGRSAQALEVFAMLVADEPGSAPLHNNMAVLYAETGDTARALASLETALRIDPAYATAYENLGDVQARLAEQAYAKAQQLGPAGAGLSAKLELLRRLREPARAAAPPSEGDGSAAHDEVNRALLGWADAWSRRDLAAYFAAYAPDFAPSGLTPAQWREQRRARVASRANIEVRLSAVRIELTGATATARFNQSYRSDTVRSEGAKRVVLARDASGRWLIREESEVRRR